MIDIVVLYEDEDLLILNKPSGVTVNKAETTREEFTIQDWLEERFKNNHAWLNADKQSDFYLRSGFVHRIDKETSGILLIAKNPESFINLQTQFRERQVEKTYIALVHGRIDSPEGEIVMPVGRLPWNRKRFGVLAGGKEAATRYRVISNFKFQISNKQTEELTLLELNPKTGRTHQIRVHLKYFNHPIFADLLYAGRKTARDDRKFLPRLFLHAKTISFIHPRTGERVSFDCPLPRELINFLSYLEH